MTAINVVLRRDRAEVLTDTAYCGPDGSVVCFASKVLIAPLKVPAVIGFRGDTFGARGMFSALLDDAMDFDRLIENAEAGAKRYLALIPVAARRRLDESGFEFVIVGYSGARQAFEAWLLGGHGEHLGRLVKMDGDITAGPVPSSDAMMSVGWQPPEGSHAFELHRDGLALLDAQRRTVFPLVGAAREHAMRCYIGGTAQATTITRDHLTQRNIGEWPDQLSQRILRDQRLKPV